MGKGFFQRESRNFNLPPAWQVLKRAENLKFFGSSTLQSGGSPETRTRTFLRMVDFESASLPASIAYKNSKNKDKRMPKPMNIWMKWDGLKF